MSYSNSLEHWLALNVLVAQSPQGADLVLENGEVDRAAGVEMGYGRRLLEASIRHGQFYYAGMKTAKE
jgi:hypothetical protein